MKVSAMEVAYNYLYESILSGEIPLGSPINEVKIAGILGISRSPVREALKKLESEGIIYYFLGRGTFVIQITEQDLEELFELRLLFEVNALKNSYKYISNEYWSEIEKEILSLDENSNEEKYYAVDKMLHTTIIKGSYNKRLVTFYDRLELQFEIVRRISALESSHFTKSKNYHLNIVRAMKDNDLKTAIKNLEEHINDVRVNTIKQYAISGLKLSNSISNQ
jgi:DNA-binding GntR family transcriptional regulator